MLSKISFNKIEWRRMYFYAALLYAFLIALDQKLATIALIIWAVFSAINYNTHALNKTRYLLVLPILYFTYILGALISVGGSLAFLEHKLSLLVFPLIFFLHSYNREERQWIFRSFIYGVLVCSTFCLVMALFRSITLDNDGFRFVPNVLEGKAFLESIIYGGNHFFGNHFSLFHQTVYFGLYLCTGIAILLFSRDIFKDKKRIILICIFTGVLFLVSNKAAFLVLALIFTFWIFTVRMPGLKKGIILLSFAALTVLFAATNPRIKESLRKIANKDIGIDKDARFDFSTRILSWDAAISLIKEHPIQGYGAGNAQEAFNSVYAQKKYTFPLKEKLNAHNQFFQIWIENGLPGLIVLMSIFIVFYQIARKSIHNKNLLYSILLVLVVNGLFESIFNRFSGVSFFSFLVCFIFSESKAKGGEH